MVDEKTGASSTPEEINAASDAALGAREYSRYAEIENARELAERTGQAQTVEPPPTPKPEKPADSETAPPDKSIQEKKPSRGGEERKAELAAEIQDLLKKRAELKAETEAAKPGDKKADPPPPPAEKKSEPAKSEAPKKPNLADFKTFGEFDQANDKYIADLITHQTRETFEADRAQREKTAAEEAATKVWRDKVTAAQEEHADYAEVAFSTTTPITPAMDGFILDSEHGARILYELGKNGSAEGKRIAALPPYAAVRALIAIEAGLTTPEKKNAPVKKQTAAPPPATNLAATNTEPADAEQAALQQGDMATYMRLANARERKAARG